MSEKTIRKQIRTLYLMTTVGYFQIAAASWVALLALRGFSLLQIGMLESIFHIVSLCFELPSGVVADVFGRRKTLIASQIASLISGTLMIFSTGFATTALALGCSALSYNLASGTREALAYDSLKQNGDEGFYARFSSTEMMLYRITNSTATLCAGLALWLGYRRAYAIDLFFGLIALGVSFRLVEIKTDETPVHYPVGQEIVSVVQESWQFLVREKKARNIMLVNALIGAVSTLVLFFLQAKAATHRHEQRAAWTCPLRDGTRRGTGIADDGILSQIPLPRDSAVWHDRCTFRLSYELYWTAGPYGLRRIYRILFR